MSNQHDATYMSAMRSVVRAIIAEEVGDGSDPVTVDDIETAVNNYVDTLDYATEDDVTEVQYAVDEIESRVDDLEGLDMDEIADEMQGLRDLLKEEQEAHQFLANDVLIARRSIQVLLEARERTLLMRAKRARVTLTNRWHRFRCRFLCRLRGCTNRGGCNR